MENELTLKRPFELTGTQWEELLGNEPAFRMRQIEEGLYKHFEEPWEISSLPKSLRSVLMDRLRTSVKIKSLIETDEGRTVKAAIALEHDAVVETVLMRYDRRTTVCISTQAGCAMACSFCATGQRGFQRQLDIHEMKEQFFWAARRLKEIDTSLRITNVVLMGMGEPLANYNSSLGFVKSLIHDFRLGARSITISTVGIVPGIKRLAEEGIQVNLAVSLHAPTDELRSTIVPINKRYPIANLIDALSFYKSKTNRRITFEYALISGINDTELAMAQLAKISNRLQAHVNLIPLNPTPAYDTPGSPMARVKMCAAILRKEGTNVTIRDTRGSDISAACGQLASGEIPVRITKYPKVSV